MTGFNSMAQSATSSQVTYSGELDSVTGTTIFTGSRRVDGIYIKKRTSIVGILTFYDTDLNVLFIIGDRSTGSSITTSWIANNGLVIKSDRGEIYVTVTHSAEGV